MSALKYEDFINTTKQHKFNVAYIKEHLLHNICTLRTEDDTDTFYNKTTSEHTNKASGVCTEIADDGSSLIITNMFLEDRKSNGWSSSDTVCPANVVAKENIYCMSPTTYKTAIHMYNDIITTSTAINFSVQNLQYITGHFIELYCKNTCLCAYMQSVYEQEMTLRVDKNNLKTLSTFINVNVNTCSMRPDGTDVYVIVRPEYFNVDVTIYKTYETVEKDVSNLIDKLNKTTSQVQSVRKEEQVPLVVTADSNNKVFRNIARKQLIGTMCTFPLTDSHIVRGVVTDVADDDTYVQLAEFDIPTKTFKNYKCYARDISSEAAVLCIKSDNSVLKLDYTNLIKNDDLYFNVKNIQSDSFITLSTNYADNTNINVSAYVKSISENELILHITETELIKLRKLLTKDSASKLSEKIVNRFYEVSLTPNEVPYDIIIKLNKDITDKVYTLYEAINMFLRGYKIRASEWTDNEYIWWDEENLQTMDNDGRRRYDLSMLAYDSWKVVGMV